MRDVFLEKHLVEIPDLDIESHGRDNSAVVQRVFPRVRESDTLIVRLEILRERNVGSQDCFSRTSRFVRDSGGFQFPIASAIYQQTCPAQATISALYARDLAGGCAGALVLAGFLIPVFGCWNTAWLTAAISIKPAIILFLVNRNSLAGSHEWVHVLRMPQR